MEEQLKKLIELQELESQFQALQREKLSIPKALSEIEKKYKQLVAQLESKRQILDDGKKEKIAFEQEVSELENSLSRSKRRLLEMRNNREYQACLREINGIKRDIKEKEDQLLDLMANLEALTEEVASDEESLEGKQKDFEKKKKKLSRKISQIKKSLALFDHQRQRVSSNIDPVLLNKFNFIKDKRNGVAIAAVQNGVCQVCHMNIPPQTFIELQKNERMHNCPNCQRFIYWSGFQVNAREECG